MNMRITLYIAIVVAAVLLIFGIAYIAAKPKANLPSTATSTAPIPQAGTTVVNGPGYTIQAISGVSLQAIMPNLDRKIVFAASVPADARAVLQSDADTAVANLRKNPDSAADWYNLAIYFHEADDFDGARVIWEFLTKAAPHNSIAFENLGKLYALDLKDYPKAEMYFKEAIVSDPKTIDPYMELYRLYLYSYKQNTSAAVDILNQAAVKFPTNSDPYYVLGTYYRDKGDTADARVAFNKTMDRARANDDVNAIKMIGDQLSKLPQ